MIRALLTFPMSLHCQIDILGKTYKGKIGGVDVGIAFPYLDSITNRENQAHKLLTAPSGAEQWVRGNQEIYWGSIIGYPKEGATVACVMITADVADEKKNTAEKISMSISKWTKSLLDYCKLCSRQDIGRAFVDTSLGYRELEFIPIIDIPRTTNIKIVFPSGEYFVSESHFIDAITFASSGQDLFLEYQMILSAHAAKQAGHNRQAIIDACSAVELCLVNKINTFCEEKDLDPDIFTEKYRSLGERFRLVSKIDAQFPVADYNNLIVKPRNDIAHNRDVYPSDKTTKELLSAVEQCLRFYHTAYY